MKPLKQIITLVLTLNFVWGYSQFSQEELLSIKDSIQSEINDSIKSKWKKDDLLKMINLLDKPDSLFPFTSYDSVYYIKYGTKDKIDLAKWNKKYTEHVLDSKKLSNEDVNTILTIINNPLNFNWGECGTPFIEGAIIFYKSGNEIAKIKHACSGGQLLTEPDNALSRWGILSEVGYTKLYEVLK